MYFIVYKTTNIKNNKFYIGTHKQSKCDPYDFDGYLGSGSTLKKAISKYGKDNFVRDTLFVFSSLDEAFNKEMSLLSHLLGRDDCYNIDKGGIGNVQDNLNRKSPEYLKEMRKRVATSMGKSNLGRQHSPEVNAKKAQPNNKHKLGKKESEETKQRKRLAKLGKPSNAVGNHQPRCSCFLCAHETTASSLGRHYDFHHKQT
jgi:group I intron endonuclease